MAVHTTSYPRTIRPELFFPNSKRIQSSGKKWVGFGLGFALLMFAAVAGLHVWQDREEISTGTRAFQVTVPAKIVANFFMIETQTANGAAQRFLIDTGSTITLVSSEFAAANAIALGHDATIESPNGGSATMSRVMVRQLALGKAKFAEVPAVVADLSEISQHIGVRIDGIVGFPVFKNHLLTLDYGRAEMTVAVQSSQLDLSNRGLVFPMRNDQRVPFVPMRVGGQRTEILLDSGSDAGLRLNPENLTLQLVSPARAGGMVSSVSGDRRQYFARINDQVEVGGATLSQAVVDFTLGTPTLGGEILKHFALTFDQRRGEVLFRRLTHGAIELSAVRSVGLSFDRDAGAWAVNAIIPETPSVDLVQPGDRCVSINGESVDQWPAERYAALLQSSDAVTFTFERGAHRSDLRIPVVNLLD